MRKAHIFAFTQIEGGSNFVEAVVSGLVCIAASKTTFPAVGKKRGGRASGDRRGWTTQKPFRASCGDFS